MTSLFLFLVGAIHDKMGPSITVTSFFRNTTERLRMVHRSTVFCSGRQFVHAASRKPPVGSFGTETFSFFLQIWVFLIFPLKEAFSRPEVCLHRSNKDARFASRRSSVRCLPKTKYLCLQTLTGPAFTFFCKLGFFQFFR